MAGLRFDLSIATGEKERGGSCPPQTIILKTLIETIACLLDYSSVIVRNRGFRLRSISNM
jgi:hypothetical protein